LLEVLAPQGKRSHHDRAEILRTEVPPKNGSSSKPWLELASVYVFAPVDNGNT
jgi:hypothetical protein